MQDVIIAKALELKFIMAEQCCPTPTQGFPAAMGLEINPEDAGNFDKINAMIKEKAAAAQCTGRLSTWPVPVGVFFPEFSVEVAKRLIDKSFDKKNMDQMKTLAKEVAPYNVTVNTLAPGYIMTERVENLMKNKAQQENITYEQALATIKDTIPAKKIGSPRGFGALCTFLASDLADYITGETILIDGGLYNSIM